MIEPTPYQKKLLNIEQDITLGTETFHDSKD